MIKRTLLLLPLLLTGCTNKTDKVYYDVEYGFNIIRHQYVVHTNDGKTFYVPPKNFYKIDTAGYARNEYFVVTNELFVYRT